jgi:hypothetical protein
MGLIFENAALSIEVGDLYTGAAPVFAGTSSFMAKAKRVRIGDEVELTNTQGAGSAVKQNRPHSREQIISLTGIVPATGDLSGPSTLASPVLYNVKVELKPLSTLSSPYTWYGMCRKWEYSTEQGDNQIEEIEINTAMDYSG